MLSEKSPPLDFELAADAVVKGDVVSLRRWIEQTPELIRARSNRPHGATLLHYLGANGVEDERQLTPPNAVDVARILLAGGADVNSVAAIYGGTTALELVASSVHPARAGVQLALLQTLLEFGAAMDGKALLAALRNGRREAAEFLGQRGDRLDLESAAGLGRLDQVRTLFNRATQSKKELGFVWACEYGQTSTIAFLLDSGINLNADGGTGLNGLHWAAVGGSLDAVELLLSRGASLTAINKYGGTPLQQAIWCAQNGDGAINYAPVIERLRR